MKLKFCEITEAKRCLEELANFREGVTVKHFTKDDSESTLCCVLNTCNVLHIHRVLNTGDLLCYDFSSSH